MKQSRCNITSNNNNTRSINLSRIIDEALMVGTESNDVVVEHCHNNNNKQSNL